MITIDSAISSEAAAATAPARPEDGPLRRFAGYVVKRAYMAIQADFQEELAKLELRIATFSALMLIIDRPDMTQSQLAAALSIERSYSRFIRNQGFSGCCQCNSRLSGTILCRCGRTLADCL